MLILKAEKREKTGKKVRVLRQRGVLPAVLYGREIKNLTLEVDSGEFEKVYQQAGESSLLSLELGEKKFPVLIHQLKRDPLTDKPIHVDFYQPVMTEEVEATVPIVFEGEAPAVKELGGTLVREISEIEVKALPQNLPHEIRVKVDNLKSFEDEILIKDLNLPPGVEIQRKSEEIVALVTPPEKVEEELEKPIEEKVEEVKTAKAEKEKKEEAVEEKEEKKENGEKPKGNEK
jgi:large subunit ribosomal protein L25